MSVELLTRRRAPHRVTPCRLTRRPMVSVVIPCYNYERFLKDAVDSVLTQEDVDLDVIIVDDASTDGSGELAAELAADDRRIRAVLHTTNMGHIATYNDGLTRVAGEYVVLLSADDLLSPGSLARAAALMEQHPEVGLVYGYAQEFHDQPMKERSGRSSWSLWSGEEWIAHHCRRGSNIIVNPEAMLRRSLMDELVGYRADMPQAADMHLWLHAASLAGVGRVNGPVQAYYRVHGQNMHLTDFASRLDDLTARRQVFDSICSLPHIEGVRSRRLENLARRAMAEEAVREAIHIWDTRPDLTGRAEQLTAFAMETDGSISQSRLWSSYLRRLTAATYRGDKAIFAATYRWRWSYRWRRWRREGV